MSKAPVPKFLIVSFLILNIGVIILGYYYLNKKEITLSDLEKYIGQYVLVKGNVIESRLSSSGKSYVLKIFDGSGYAYVVHKYAEYRNCSKVFVKGMVSEFRGKYYIFVNRKSDIICLK